PRSGTSAYSPNLRRSSRRCPLKRMIAESALISSHLISTLAPLGKRTSPSSPRSKVRPLIIAVRLGGLVIPLRTKDVKSETPGAFGCGMGGSSEDWGKNGLRPSRGVTGIANTDWGISTWVAVGTALIRGAPPGLELAAQAR